jgi:hypothetical protein
MTDQEFEKSIEDGLRRAGKNISPRRGLLSEIIRKTPVTDGDVPRYSVREGRLMDVFSAKPWKVFVSAAALIFVVAVGIASQQPLFKKSLNSAIFQVAGNQKGEFNADKIGDREMPLAKESSAENNVVEKKDNYPLTADDVDVAVIAILASLDEEYPELSDEADSSFLDDESEVINNFIQIYDESTI